MYNHAWILDYKNSRFEYKLYMTCKDCLADTLRRASFKLF